ncbi:MAG: hypothetical protein KJ069_01505 [Anaerolineae bacterium]|nr:hypothetical protein [Anaerolineae bacterium]
MPQKPKLTEELEQENLRQSADLYAELYAEDEELRELTQAAMVGWPDRE